MKGCDRLMLCQNCQKNPATIHLYTSTNGQRQEIDLCQNCYQLLKQQNSNGQAPQGQYADPFGFGSLDSFFRAMGATPDDQSQANQGPQTKVAAKVAATTGKTAKVCSVNTV